MGNEISSPDAKAMFIATDLNSNGRIDIDEFRPFLEKHFKDLRAFAKIIVKIYGTDCELSPKQFEEFYSATKITDRQDPGYIGRRLFDFIDVDHSGGITNDELYDIVLDLELPHDENKDAVRGLAREMEICEDDANYRIEFTYDEFCGKCLQILGGLWRDSQVGDECRIE